MMYCFEKQMQGFSYNLPQCPPEWNVVAIIVVVPKVKKWRKIEKTFF